MYQTHVIGQRTNALQAGYRLLLNMKMTKASLSLPIRKASIPSKCRASCHIRHALHGLDSLSPTLPQQYRR